MAAAALNNQILTYSVTKNVAYFNVFDVATASWSGSGLITGPPVDAPPSLSSKSSTPVGAIVGGAVGALLAIALALFFFVRRRRQSTSKSANTAELAQAGPEANKFDGTQQVNAQQYDPVYVQYVQPQYDQGYAQPQHEQGYVPYEQAQAYQHPSPFIPPPPPVNQDADVSYKIYQPETVSPAAGIDASYKVPHSDLTDASMNSPTVVNSSPYISPASYRDSFQPGSPESVRAKVSSGTQGPQFVPNAPVAMSEARSPQVVSSSIVGH